MTMARVVEGLAGLASGILGLLTLAFLLFGPESRYVKSVTTCTPIPNGVSCSSTGLDHITSGAIQIDIFPLSIVLLGLTALLFAVVAVGAVLHARTRSPIWQACLWATTGLLLIVVLLTQSELVVALAPALVLAAIASGVALIAAREQTGRDYRRRVARSMEAFCGVAAGVLGFAAAALLLVAPGQYPGQTSSCDAAGECSMQITSSPSPLLANPVGTLLLVALALAVFGLVAYSAVQHSRAWEPVWRAWLWGIALLLVVWTILAGFSVGLFFLPSAVLALFAALSSFGRRQLSQTAVVGA